MLYSLDVDIRVGRWIVSWWRQGEAGESWGEAAEGAVSWRTVVTRPCGSSVSEEWPQHIPDTRVVRDDGFSLLSSI